LSGGSTSPLHHKQPNKEERVTMKVNIRIQMFVFLITAVFMTACTASYKPVPSFQAQSIDMESHEKKVAHLVLIFDASASMVTGHEGYQKLDIAKSVVNNFNTTMPDSDIQVTAYSFGHAESISAQTVEAQLPLQPYNRQGLSAAVDRVDSGGGISRLDSAIADAAAQLSSLADPIAMVIVSDGQDMGMAPLEAAKELKAHHGDRLCIHTVHVGNAADGQALLDQIANASGCGGAVNADELASGTAMNRFVSNVLLSKKMDQDGDRVADNLDRCPDTPRGAAVDENGCPLDSDKDGVADFKDDCPDTRAGTTVDASGCTVVAATKSAEVTDAGTWLYKDIQFENNQADLKPGSYGTLDEISTALKAQSGLNIEIQGHTDGKGARSYNLLLSQNRAESVKSYLETMGIDPARMTVRGYGPDRPIASNDSKEGRAKNRRVEIKPIQ
jgi:OOP family OmpA-OmpF porin